ncbi:MAG: PAS domain S-box protein, partial [Methanolobus sp.]|uniref:PAS domain S-box protein n=1 Tax=Methanolobus sp. TaxID=1874737 RepID=UPI002731067E
MKNRSQLPDQNSSSILSYEKESVERSVTESFTDCHSDLVTAILETVPFPAFCKDAQGKYTGCNKAFEELLGIRHGEIINKTVYDLGPKEIAGQHFEKDNELYEKPGKQHYEGQVKDKNGNIRDVIFDKATITRPDGAVQGIVGVISDITEQKLTEQKVRRQDKVLNVTLDALTHPFMIIDASDHTIRLANSFATSHYNITPSSKCYEASHGLCEPCCGSEHPCPMEEIRKTGKPAKAEHIHIDSEGRKVYVEVNAYPIFDDNGDLDSIIEYSIDITERKQVIDELEKSREQFMLAVNGSNDGIWDWDLRSNSLYLSAKWKQMIGYEDHELPNMFSTFADRMHPDDSIRVQENLSKYLKGNISTYNIEFRLQHKNGSYVWILARGEALRDKDGVPYRMAGSHTDITEIKQAMEELRLREERLKSLVDILQSRHDSVQEFLDLALNEAMKLTESKIGYIYHYNETRKEFALNTWSRDVMKECSIVQPQTIYKLEDTGIWGEAVRQRKTIIVNDFHAPDPLKKGYPQGHVELHRFMTVPIFKKDKIVAVAGVANKGSEYTGNDTLQLKLLMDSVWNIVSQIAAEEAMCESEEKYRGLFENALSGVSIHEMVRDEEGNPVDYVFLEANDAFERQTGLKVADVLGRRATEVLPGIERASFIERYGEVTLTGNPVIFEEFSEPLQRYYSVSAYRMDKDIFATVFQDITESKRKETYSEMEREILQILNESGSLKESIQLVLSSLKKCIGVDAAGIRLKDGDDFPYIVHDGFSQEFLLNENSLTVHEQDGCLCRDHNGNVKLECTCGLVISGNTDPSSPLFTPGGSCWTNDSFPFLELPSDQDPRLHPRNQCIHQGYASLALVPIRTKNQIVGLLQLNSRRKGIFSLAAIEQLEGIAAHIGEALTRNRAEEALRESEQRFRRLAENADDIIYRYGFAPKRGFTYVSPAATKITGYTPEEHYADPDLGFKLVHPDDRYILEELAKGNDKDRTAVTLRWVRRDGNVIWAEQKNILLYDEEGNLIALEGIARDITERKRMEDELAQSEEKYRLLSNVSFEGIIIHDNGIALEVNEALSSI